MLKFQNLTMFSIGHILEFTLAVSAISVFLKINKKNKKNIFTYIKNAILEKTDWHEYTHISRIREIVALLFLNIFFKQFNMKT